MQLLNAFIAFLIRGGPAMLALLACSILVVAIIFERVVFLSRQREDAEKLIGAIKGRLDAGDIAGAIAECSRKPTALSNVLKAGLEREPATQSQVTDALAIATRKYLRPFEQNLAVIGTIAVIAPFIGLFGTVLGIIRAFDDIALRGNSSPAIVAAGVSEALITTAAGLFVAVTAVIFFNFFKNQNRVYREDTLWAAEELADMLERRQQVLSR
ncbi:MAG: MotA/TolQ/ExbB proton channel family protein [Candidatus Eremiobacteraeota bacterium]|nr:MotA/TolQ/ExbB proton channel family protein [Candidatus Eremiobacteraeota bacterium]